MTELPLWIPKQNASSQMAYFALEMFKKNYIPAATYSDLYKWSVREPELFWQECVDGLGLVWKKKPHAVLQKGARFQDAVWFPGGELDFVSHYLHGDPSEIVLIALQESGERRFISRAELTDQVSRLAHAFLQFGVQSGDRIAAIVTNQWFSVVSFLATAAIGAIWSSCSPDFGAVGILDRFQQIRPKWLVAVGSYAYKGERYSLSEKLSEIMLGLPECLGILGVGSPEAFQGVPRVHFWDEVLSRSTPLTHFHVAGFNDPLCILYSSGTTGAPKCIVHGVGRVLLEHLKELKWHVDLKAGDRFFYYTTCGWMMWNWWLSGLAAQATLVSYDGHPFYPQITRLWDEVDQNQITVFGTSARFLMEMAQARVKFPANRLVSLRAILSTGSPLSADLFRYVYQFISPQVLLGSISGGTDILGCFMLSNPMQAVYAGQLQSPSLGLAIDCCNEWGHSTNMLEAGELVCRAPFPSMPIGFWGDTTGDLYQKAYFEHFDGVWAHGDWVYKTAEGGFVIQGRSDAVLNPGGIRIGTAEIYRAVEMMDEIQEALAVGLPDQQGDILIWLFVVLKKDVAWQPNLSKKIREKIKRQLSPRHVPRRIKVVPDIPKTFNGKKAEIAVRQILMGEPVRNLNALANPESLHFFKR